MDATSNMDLTILDEGHLATQTFGDRALAGEILQLFDEQCGRFASVIVDATAPAERALALHTLKGAARAVGAFRLAGLLEDHEDLDGDSCEHRAGELTKAIEEARAAALRHRTSLSRGGS
jgi:HPt (histidine-containing phosphotransfer) domain-containing protein